MTSVQKRIFNNIGVCMATLIVSSCSSSPAQIQQDSLLTLQTPPHKCFKQTPGGRLHPAEFFTCDKSKNQCYCTGASEETTKRSIPSNVNSGGSNHA